MAEDDTHTADLTDFPQAAPAAPAPEPSDSPASDRLRAFEDEHFGPDCVRIGGKIERGSGSPFARMSDEDKKHYAALEKMIDSERRISDARAALAQAEADHAAAEAALRA